MGYESQRFIDEVDDELKCPICCCVLRDAVQAPECEHTFCSACINEWLSVQCNCPVDRRPLTEDQLTAAPRILRNFLAKLQIKCDFAGSGCEAVVRLESLSTHTNECDYNPFKPVTCEKGCGLVLLRNQINRHNCLYSMRQLISEQQKQINSLKDSKRIHTDLISELKYQLKHLQETELSRQQSQINLLQETLNRMQQRLDEDTASDDGGQRKRNRSTRETNTDHHHHYHHDDSVLSPPPPTPPPPPPQQQQQQQQGHNVEEPTLITFYGAVVRLQLTSSERVHQVKRKLVNQESLSYEELLLFYAGEQLQDDRSLASYGIRENRERGGRHLVLRLRDGMRIFVETIENKTIQVQVEPNETIEMVKVKIHQQEGISPCDQRLLLNGRDLADLRTIADYGIRHRATLKLDLHLGGPCPICQTQFKNSASTSSSL